MKLTKKYLDDLTYQVIGGAIEVHKELGPGLLEKVYEKCLFFELLQRKIQVQTQGIVPIIYKGNNLNSDLRCDLLVENCLVIELKAVENVHPLHKAQLLSYMKLLQVPKGILLNFHCQNIFHEGQTTMVNELYRSLPDR